MTFFARWPRGTEKRPVLLGGDVAVPPRVVAVLDLVFVVAIVACFAVTLGYVVVCDRWI
jgi:hypothetical protein